MALSVPCGRNPVRRAAHLPEEHACLAGHRRRDAPVADQAVCAAPEPRSRSPERGPGTGRAVLSGRTLGCPTSAGRTSRGPMTESKRSFAPTSATGPNGHDDAGSAPSDSTAATPRSGAALASDRGQREWASPLRHGVVEAASLALGTGPTGRTSRPIEAGWAVTSAGDAADTSLSYSRVHLRKVLRSL
jgi:hypothetical protein